MHSDDVEEVTELHMWKETGSLIRATRLVLSVDPLPSPDTQLYNFTTNQKFTVLQLERKLILLPVVFLSTVSYIDAYAMCRTTSCR